MISLIVPVLNEEEVLRENFRHLEALKKDSEIIFVDGGSSDGTMEIAGKLGKALKSSKGRALQMNCGAREAKGDMLLFLHADSYIEEKTLSAAYERIKDGAIGGCFTQRLNNDKPIYRIIETIGNRRARARKIFYGDQGIFVRKDIFFNLGGFPHVSVMEDVIFSQKLNRLGRVDVLDELIYVSTRRWERGGFFNTNLAYMVMALLFYLRVPLSIIKKLYRDVR